MNRTKEFIKNHYGKLLLGVAVVVGFSVGASFPPEAMPPMPIPPPQVKPLTCADLPAISAEMDQITAFVAHYYWALALIFILASLKVMDICTLLIEGVDWITRRVCRRLARRNQPGVGGVL